MKKILRTFFVFLILSLVLPVSIFAEEVKKVSEPILLADVNITDAKIVSQDGNNFKISFNITNGKGIQSGVKYGVELNSYVNGSYEVVDQKIYDESLSISEDSSVLKEVSYVSPNVFDGEYTLFITISNESDFPFAKSFLGNIKLSSSGGISILRETCNFSVLGDSKDLKYGLLEGVDIDPKETLNLNCTVFNNTDKKVELSPSLEIRERGVYGEKIAVKYPSYDKIVLTPKEKKSFSLSLPKIENPKLYYVNTLLESKEYQSNTVNGIYLVRGNIATIDNLFFDKDSYKKGDEAHLSLMWSSIFGPNLRDQKSEMGAGSILVDLSIKNSNGIKCSDQLSKEIQNNLSKNEIIVPINRKCIDPTVFISLKDTKTGEILDEKVFETTTISIEGNNNLTIIIVVALLILLIIVLIVLKNKKMIGKLPMNIFILLIVASFGFILFTRDTEAATYSISYGNCSMTGSFNTTKATFYNNEKISFVATAKLARGGTNACNNVLARGYVSVGTPNPNNRVIPIIGVSSADLGSGYTLNPGVTKTGYASVYGTHVEGSYTLPILVQMSTGPVNSSGTGSSSNYTVNYNVLGLPVASLDKAGSEPIESGLTETIYWDSENAKSCVCHVGSVTGDECVDYYGDPVPHTPSGSFETENLTQTTKYYFTCTDDIELGSVPEVPSSGVSYSNNGTCTINVNNKTSSCGGGGFCTGGQNEQVYSNGSCPLTTGSADGYNYGTCSSGYGNGYLIGIDTYKVCLPYGI